MDLALNNQQMLICHKAYKTKPKQMYFEYATLSTKEIIIFINETLVADYSPRKTYEQGKIIKINRSNTQSKWLFNICKCSILLVCFILVNCSQGNVAQDMLLICWVLVINLRNHPDGIVQIESLKLKMWKVRNFESKFSEKFTSTCFIGNFNGTTL